MTKSHPARPARRVMAWIAGITAVLAIAGGAVLVSNLSGSDSPRASEIPRYVPADADTVVIAPYTESWWSKLGAMAPQELQIQSAKPAEELSIENIGYSRSQDKTERELANTGPLRVFYIEATGEAEAESIKSWLNGAPGFDYRLVHQHGRVLAVTPVWVASYPEPEQAMTGVAAYKADVTDSQAAMWFSPEKEVASLALEGSREAGLLGTLVEKGFGFTGGTAWSGTSKDGYSWEGTFATGGVNPDKIDFSQASSALMEERKVLMSAKDPAGKSSQSSFSVTDPGVSAVLAAASVKVDGKEGALGVSSVSPSVRPVKGETMSAVVEVTAWNRAATGNLGESESVLTRSMSANGNEMNMSFTYAPEQTK